MLCFLLNKVMAKVMWLAGECLLLLVKEFPNLTGLNSVLVVKYRAISGFFKLGLEIFSVCGKCLVFSWP